MNDIGLRCLLASVTGFVFIRGVIFANFQAEGHFCSVKVLFKIAFNNQFGKPSGPEALGGGVKLSIKGRKRLIGFHGLKEGVFDEVCDCKGIKIVNFVKVKFRAESIRNRK